MTAGKRVWFLCGFLVTSLMLCDIYADGTIKKITDPTANLNLSPFQQWRSAYECLQNKSDSCPGNFTLTDYGWVSTTLEETDSYCSGGCAAHTMAVLTCISLVKCDYKFINNAKVQDINNTITHGCAFGFNGTTLISNARTISRSQIAVFVSILPVIFLVNHMIYV